MKVRIGIDVGGTFTDAVAVDNDTYELIGYLKIPTTHTAEEGVAAGIVKAIGSILEKYNIAPEDVVFIAHGTTQATNALLEGDVSNVGIVGLGSGGEGLRAKADSVIGDIELAKGKYLHTESEYVDLGSTDCDAKIMEAVERLVKNGAEVIVASGAFSVDDPSGELKVIDYCQSKGISATGSHEISKLYGLKIRTRTAAINACILPKMIETANMTEESVEKTGINAQLMIMRCDGGVMDVQEVKKRPILTMLSGPAAGVAGALMYEKISNGFFLEVGGTSTDISVIKDGMVMIKYAEVGGHKTYVNSLDVRTIGIAGGSMIRINKSGVVDAGPRSAHIANLPYACFTPPEEIEDPEVVTFQPMPGDAEDYLMLQCKNGKKLTLTVSCAANYLGLIKPENYSYGNVESARIALEAVGRYTGQTAQQVAESIMEKAAAKVKPVVEQMIIDYKLERKYTTLVGGGGGAAAIVPYVGKVMDMEARIAKNAEVISPIGVALAMVRDMVERIVLNPTEDDILAIKQEAYDKAISSGATPESVEVNIEIDTTRNLVRAIAVGATELRAKDLMQDALTEEEIIEKIAGQLEIPMSDVTIEASTGSMFIVKGNIVQKSLFGLLKKKSSPVRVIDNEGVIRLQKKQGTVTQVDLSKIEKSLQRIIEEATVYNDGGEEIPDLFLVFNKQIRSFTGLTSASQVVALAGSDLKMLAKDTKVFALTCRR